ncbi:helix-turn-helix domain-containing protein [Aureliella helgolandensis]|uniref:Helix-turn-helix domain protein n=1 Tax=Aureliella helgolandensis TaxID=2527968 RepID=A0A518GDJ4_9BACT|nr:helix-turn-helix domain-containing protein [Aureliella helgolandensis]QDV26661.1 Helix-turn-helix domain protein [Aureliella helgolandensis]
MPASRRPPPLLVDSITAAATLAISPRKLWELAKRGDIPTVRIDRTVRYSIDDLRAYVDRQRAG